MRKLTYPAVFKPSDTGYWVFFPDFPECTSCGEDLMEALEQASEALELHICVLEKNGFVLPAPSEKPEVTPEADDGYLIAAVTIFPEKYGK